MIKVEIKGRYLVTGGEKYKYIHNILIKLLIYIYLNKNIFFIIYIPQIKMLIFKYY